MNWKNALGTVLLVLLGVTTCAVAWDKRGGDHGPGYVDQLEIISTYPAYGGASFGNVGPYTVIVAIAHNKLDPNHPANAGIVDVKLAPRDAHGMVDYSEDVVILRPTSAANAKRVLFYDVVNRGNKGAAGAFDGGGATFAAGQQGNGLLLRLGYTIVFSGWQGNVLQTGPRRCLHGGHERSRSHPSGWLTHHGRGA